MTSIELKEQGNQRFKNGDYLGAVGLYSKALELEKKGKDKELKVTLFSNAAACYLKLKEIDKALECCDRGLELNCTHQKLLFRRAQASKEFGDFNQARYDLQVLKTSNGDKLAKQAAELYEIVKANISHKFERKDVVPMSEEEDMKKKQTDLLELLEFYLSDENLAKDEFFLCILGNTNGILPVDELLTGRKCGSLCKKIDFQASKDPLIAMDIVRSIVALSKKLEMTDDGYGVFRREPYPSSAVERMIKYHEQLCKHMQTEPVDAVLVPEDPTKPIEIFKLPITGIASVSCSKIIGPCIAITFGHKGSKFAPQSKRVAMQMYKKDGTEAGINERVSLMTSGTAYGDCVFIMSMLQTTDYKGKFGYLFYDFDIEEFYKRFSFCDPFAMYCINRNLDGILYSFPEKFLNCVAMASTQPTGLLQNFIRKKNLEFSVTSNNKKFAWPPRTPEKEAEIQKNHEEDHLEESQLRSSHDDGLISDEEFAEGLKALKKKKQERMKAEHKETGRRDLYFEALTCENLFPKRMFTNSLPQTTKALAHSAASLQILRACRELTIEEKTCLIPAPTDEVLEFIPEKMEVTAGEGKFPEDGEVISFSYTAREPGTLDGEKPYWIDMRIAAKGNLRHCIYCLGEGCMVPGIEMTLRSMRPNETCSIETYIHRHGKWQLAIVDLTYYGLAKLSKKMEKSQQLIPFLFDCEKPIEEVFTPEELNPFEQQEEDMQADDDDDEDDGITEDQFQEMLGNLA
eukprot:TRINITY_DN426_c1_g1_i2.p1 TRINITY_DN426_c1_g1~~TRINITY_DN426_c1_g1_i2.p1  ORF type:complete len:759 (-),score=236.69 TRINITY_DN426_c1_g1_i2:175-2403(-)